MKVKTLTLPLTLVEQDLEEWARTVLLVTKKPRQDRLADVRTLAARRILNREAKA